MGELALLIGGLVSLVILFVLTMDGCVLVCMVGCAYAVARKLFILYKRTKRSKRSLQYRNLR